MTPSAQAEIISHLVSTVLVQRAVRNGEAEGMVFPLEEKLKSVYELELISMTDLDHLLGILKTPFPKAQDNDA